MTDFERPNPFEGMTVAQKRGLLGAMMRSCARAPTTPAFRLRLAELERQSTSGQWEREREREIALERERETARQRTIERARREIAGGAPLPCFR